MIPKVRNGPAWIRASIAMKKYRGVLIHNPEFLDLVVITSHDWNTVFKYALRVNWNLDELSHTDQTRIKHFVRAMLQWATRSYRDDVYSRSSMANTMQIVFRNAEDRTAFLFQWMVEKDNVQKGDLSVFQS